MAISEPADIPGACLSQSLNDDYYGQLQLSRTESCSEFSLTAEAYEKTALGKGDLIAQAEIKVFQDWKLDPTSLSVDHQIEIKVDDTAGAFDEAGGLLTVFNTCGSGSLKSGGDCSLSDGEAMHVLAAAVQKDDVVSYSWTEDYSFASESRINSTDNPGDYVDITLTPNSTPTIPGVGKVTADGQVMFRCDQEIAPTGCVNPNFIPTMVFDPASNPLVRPVAENIADAQATRAGHEGVEGSGDPLHRVSEGRKRKNYRLACGQSMPASPELYSCDEYPFQSSAEGGNGASTREVTVASQRSQGGVIVQFYKAQRVLQEPDISDPKGKGDAYWVATNLSSPDFGTFNVALNGAVPAGSAVANPVSTPDGALEPVGSVLHWVSNAPAMHFGDPTDVAFNTFGNIGVHALSNNLDSTWFAESGMLGRQVQSKFLLWDDTTHSIHQYGGPVGTIFSMVVGSDGLIYFSMDGQTPTVGVFDPASGTYSRYVTSSVQSQPLLLSEDSNGTVWFSGYDDIGTVDAHGIQMDLQHPLSLPGVAFTAATMVADWQGQMWFDTVGDGIYSADETGTLTQHYIQQPVGATSYSATAELVASPYNGSLWVGLDTSNQGPATFGAVAEFSSDGTESTYLTGIKVVPNTGQDPTLIAETRGLAPASDGGLWLQQHSSGAQISGAYSDVIKIDDGGTATVFDTGGGLDPVPAAIESVYDSAWNVSSADLFVRKTDPNDAAGSGRVFISPVTAASRTGSLSAPLGQSDGLIWVAYYSPGSIYQVTLFCITARPMSL